MSKYTFKRFQAEYPDDDACLTKLMEINCGGTNIFCPTCGVRCQFHMMSKRRAFACQECGHHVYPCAHTIFHKSRTKLTVWFFAMYLMTSTRHGVAAKEIQRQTGVTYKCAWRICSELRKLMATADDTGSLHGHVEVDETFVGGVQKQQGPKRPRIKQDARHGDSRTRRAAFALVRSRMRLARPWSRLSSKTSKSALASAPTIIWAIPD